MTGAVVSSRKQQHGFLLWGFSCVIYPAATSRAELVDWHVLPSIQPSCSFCSPAVLSAASFPRTTRSPPAALLDLTALSSTQSSPLHSKKGPGCCLFLIWGLRWMDTVVLGYQGGHLGGGKLRLW